MFVAWRLYDGGARVDGGEDLQQALSARGRGQFVWLRLVDPSPRELHQLADALGLPELAVEDSMSAHQRPKLERYGDGLFLVARPAAYREAEEVVELGEVHVFTAPDFAVTIRHGAIGTLDAVDQRLADAPELCATGPHALLHAVLDEVVDGYEPVIVELERDVEEIELAVFGEDVRRPTARIYALMREVLDFHRACANLIRPLEQLATGHVADVDPVLQPYFRDVADHTTLVVERLEAFRQLLDGTLQANLSLIGLRENRDQRKISAWAAMALVPTIVGGIWGMNVGLPLQETRYGFVVLLLIMVATLGYLYWRFRRNDWL